MQEGILDFISWPRKLAALMRTLLLALFWATALSAHAAQPNVVVIITDDLGYGDIGCYGAKQIKTPHIDRLAKEGQRFTHAYAPAATCTPTRYSIMTGEYAWRQPAKKTSILDGDAPLCIEPTRFTLPKLMRAAGYQTALIGKWHLGLGDGVTPVDFNKAIAPGPLEIGFDSAFFIPATVDRVPTVYINNHHVDKLDPADPIKVSYQKRIGDEPTGTDNPELLKVKADKQHSNVIHNGISRIGFMTGGNAARWIDEDIADTITGRAVKFIEQKHEKPFFLYLGTHDPHVPRAPHPRFRGVSGCGIRGDTIAEIDWTVGEVLAALERSGQEKNTLVIFTSDNGPVLFDGYYDEAEETLAGHLPAGGLRGGKYLVYEGGARVPLIMRLPGVLASGDREGMVSLMDLMPTLADMTGQKIPANVHQDGQTLWSYLTGVSGESPREEIVMQGISGSLSLRVGNWKYIPATSSQASGMGSGADPRDKRFSESIIVKPLLYDLSKDPAEQHDLSDKEPAKLAELAARLSALRELPTAAR